MNNLTDALRVLLATNFVLYLKTHFIHWNVTGMFFPELHKMFEEQYNDLWLNTDTIAEKIRQLDCAVTLTPQDQITLSVVDPAQQLGHPKDYLRTLLNDHQRMLLLLNKVFAIAEQSNNQAVMNYLAERMDAHAKMRWFIKATLGNESV
jgi:starvation-inducible DNA-binding protein